MFEICWRAIILRALLPTCTKECPNNKGVKWQAGPCWMCSTSMTCNSVFLCVSTPHEVACTPSTRRSSTLEPVDAKKGTTVVSTCRKPENLRRSRKRSTCCCSTLWQLWVVVPFWATLSYWRKNPTYTLERLERRQEPKRSPNWNPENRLNNVWTNPPPFLGSMSPRNLQQDPRDSRTPKKPEYLIAPSQLT